MAWGAGLATIDSAGNTLDTWYRWLGWGEYGSDPGADGAGGDSVHWDTIESKLGMRDHRDEVRNVTIRPVRISVDVDAAPASPEDAYLRLHLLSHRLAPPHSLNMDGTFGALNNVAWTNLGPVAVSALDDVRLKVKLDGGVLSVHGLDKFPRMTDYVVPTGVRIADADRVRLGAHLAEGTTVMHEGFCNFNAGTLGTSMVEGRISAGVVVGNGSDVGGGASADQVLAAFKIITSDPNVKAVLVNIFGGIMKCTTIAEAIVVAAKSVGFTVPLVVRLEGTEVEEGRRILEESDVELVTATDLGDAAEKVVATLS